MLNFIWKYQYEDMTVFTMLTTSVHRNSSKVMISEKKCVTSSIQILGSKYYSPLTGTKNPWFQD